MKRSLKKLAGFEGGYRRISPLRDFFLAVFRHEGCRSATPPGCCQGGQDDVHAWAISVHDRSVQKHVLLGRPTRLPHVPAHVVGKNPYSLACGVGC